MAAGRRAGGSRAVVGDPNANRRNGGDSGATALGQQASQALEGLRTVIEQASQVLSIAVAFAMGHLLAALTRR